MQEEPNKYVKELTQEKYKYGFTTEVHTDIIERGLNEDVIRLISAKKNEPEWLLEFRLKGRPGAVQGLGKPDVPAARDAFC